MDATTKKKDDRWVLFDVRDVEGRVMSAHYWPMSPAEEQEALERARRARRRLREYRPPPGALEPIQMGATLGRIDRMPAGQTIVTVTNTNNSGEDESGLAVGVQSPVMLQDHVGMEAVARGEDDPLFPVPALNRAVFAQELGAISDHVRGYLVSLGRIGIAGGKSGQRVDDAAREQLAQFQFVKRRLPPEFQRMCEIVIDQVLQIEERPPLSVSEVGAEITQAKDERVRKGGVIGYYRALFQMIHRLQREFQIEEFLRRQREQRAREACS